MADTVQFQAGEGVVSPPMSLRDFLRDYAKEKGVPVHNGRLNTRHEVRGITFDGEDLVSDPPRTAITVQEFMLRCDNWAARSQATDVDRIRTLELGDYDDVEVNGNTQVMTMNEQEIPFEYIRRVFALTQEAPKFVAFSNGEGVDGENVPGLISFLVGYAREKGVPNIGDMNTDDDSYEGIVYTNEDSDPSEHGLYESTPDIVITPQEFLKRCDDYQNYMQRYRFELTDDYAVKVLHGEKLVRVGCQRISFDNVKELVDILDEVTA